MERGFSLIEMVIVLVIIGIVAAMAVPRYSDAADGYKLTASENQVRNTLDSWSARANSSSMEHTVFFDPSTEMIYLYEGAAKTRDLASDTLDLGSAPYQVDLLKTDLVTPTNLLTINGFGLFDRDATLYLVRGDLMVQFQVQGGGKTRIDVKLSDPVPVPDPDIKVVEVGKIDL